MTSEGPHHPGQQPDEVSPGAGGPAPYGDRPAQQQHTGYGVTTPDLGWAPPPPAQPGPPAPAWAASQDQPPHRGAAQPPQPGEAGSWNPPGDAQPAWLAQGEQPGHQPWAAGGSAEQPGWAPGEQSAPAWAQQPAARGAAQVPSAAPDAWPAQNGGSQDPAQSGGWHNDPAPQGEQPRQPDWAAAPQQDDPARSGGWAGAQQDEQPGWAPAEPPAARGAAQVPQAAPAWGGQQEPVASGGWHDERPEQSGGWTAGQQDDQPRQPDWAAAPQQDDPARSGGWAGAGQDDQPRQPGWAASEDRSPGGWEAPAEQRPGGAWGGSADDPAPARDEPGAWGAAAAPQPVDRPDENGWTPAEPAATPPARATASVPGDGGPPVWSPVAAGQPPQRTGADRPALDNDLPSRTPSLPDVEPWDAAEAWGRADAEPARADTDREADRAEQSPIYQPAPGPGISPANAVPLPPQEQRVPGASLAAAPPADYTPPAQFGPEQPAYAEQSAREAGAPAYEREQAGWAPAGSRHEEPQSPAGPVVPAPRTSPEAAEPAAGSVSASAAVPLASRVMPPADEALRPAGTPTPQPRVYGRPARPEPVDEPEPAEQEAVRAEHAPPPRFEPTPEPRFDDRPAGPNGFDDRVAAGPNGFDDRASAGPNGFAGAAPVAPASPAPPPAFPPGVPSFVDAPPQNRPVNGVRPHAGDRPADQFGGPADQFGGPADHFGGPGAGGGAPVGAPVPGYGPAPTADPAPGGGFPPSFPPPAQPPAGPSWDQPPAEQNRFDAFKPEAEPKTEAPTPKVRNGRVLAAVLVAAVLILAVPLGLLMLLGKVGGSDTPAFDPAVGTCVKKSGDGAAAADCAEAGAFTIVSKVDAPEKCADPAQPHVRLAGDGANRVLCLKPAGQ